jgi:hypothetical protein
MLSRIKYFYINNRTTVFLVRDENTKKQMTLVSTYIDGNPKPKVDVYEDGLVYQLLLIKYGVNDRAYGFKKLPLPG